MLKQQLVIQYNEYSSAEKLPKAERDLLQMARQSALLAYAPYSSFYVGAALLLQDGTIVCGNNQENAAYR